MQSSVVGHFGILQDAGKNEKQVFRDAAVDIFVTHIAVVHHAGMEIQETQLC